MRLRNCIGLLLVSLVATAPALGTTFTLPPESESVVGQVQYITASNEDTLADIARRYNVGRNELILANPGVDPWLPPEGTRIVLPTRYVLPNAAREGVVLNVPEMRLYYYPAPKNGEPPQVITYPISIGRGDWETPLGSTSIIAKTENPAWIPPDSIREEHAADGDPLPARVPPGPDNPLGQFALRLGLPGYLIHGTNKPYGIGMRVTHGCVRLYPEDIEVLFGEVPEGTLVQIVHQPYKLGWHLGKLYLEAHPAYSDKNNPMPLTLTPLVRSLLAVTEDYPDYPVDYDQLRRLTLNPNGMPRPIEVGG